MEPSASISKKVDQYPSDSDETDEDKFHQIPKGYDPKLYENLEVDKEGKEILQYITK